MVKIMTLSKTNHRLVPNKVHVGGKIMFERIGVWTRQLRTPEYIKVDYFIVDSGKIGSGIGCSLESL